MENPPAGRALPLRAVGSYTMPGTRQAELEAAIPRLGTAGEVVRGQSAPSTDHGPHVEGHPVCRKPVYFFRDASKRRPISSQLRVFHQAEM